MRRVFVIFAIIVPVSLSRVRLGLRVAREWPTRRSHVRGNGSARRRIGLPRNARALASAGASKPQGSSVSPRSLAFAAWATCKAIVSERELHQKKTAFVAAVTHELRTPLTTLRMHAEMLDGDLVPENRKARVYAELVRESNRLSRLVENVLAMSKLEEGRWVLEKKRGDLASAVETIVRHALRPARTRSRIRFPLKFSAAKECPSIAFDAAPSNSSRKTLVDNALKYADPNVIDVEVRAERDVLETRRERSRSGNRSRATRSRLRSLRTRRQNETGERAPGSRSFAKASARAHGGDARLIVDREGRDVRQRLATVAR